jgi:hypothetical protein
MADDLVWTVLVKRCGIQPEKQAPTSLPGTESQTSQASERDC